MWIIVFSAESRKKEVRPVKYQKWHIGTAAEQDTALLKEAGYPSLLATVLAAVVVFAVIRMQAKKKKRKPGSKH